MLQAESLGCPLSQCDDQPHSCSHLNPSDTQRDLSILATSLRGVLGTCGTLHMALRGPRGPLRQGSGDPCGSLGNLRMALGASSNCHWSGLGRSRAIWKSSKNHCFCNTFVKSGGISIRSEVLEGSRALSWGPHGSFAGCPGILWMLRTIPKQSLAQKKSLRLKREAPGGGTAPCSSIKLMVF